MAHMHLDGSFVKSKHGGGLSLICVILLFYVCVCV